MACLINGSGQLNPLLASPGGLHSPSNAIRDGHCQRDSDQVILADPQPKYAKVVLVILLLLLLLLVLLGAAALSCCRLWRLCVAYSMNMSTPHGRSTGLLAMLCQLSCTPMLHAFAGPCCMQQVMLRLDTAAHKSYAVVVHPGSNHLAPRLAHWMLYM